MERTTHRFKKLNRQKKEMYFETLFFTALLKEVFFSFDLMLVVLCLKLDTVFILLKVSYSVFFHTVI